MNISLEEELDKKNYKDLDKKMFISWILCQESITSIAEFWDLHSGKHYEVIKKNLIKIGLDNVSDDLVKTIKNHLSSYNARRGKEQSISDNTIREVFYHYSSRMNTSELRCEICGYQFREKDLSPLRLSYAEEFALEFTNYITEWRKEDEFKPIFNNKNESYYTNLEIDHILPISSLGGSESDNLQILCRFCNSGKLHYTYAYEPISEIVSNSISFQYKKINKLGNILTTVVATLRKNGGQCSYSNYNSSNSEITVKMIKGKTWFVPWNLEVISYKHMAESGNYDY